MVRDVTLVADKFVSQLTCTWKYNLDSDLILIYLKPPHDGG